MYMYIYIYTNIHTHVCNVFLRRRIELPATVVERESADIDAGVHSAWPGFVLFTMRLHLFDQGLPNVRG
jgi:hypothetical protein